MLIDATSLRALGAFAAASREISGRTLDVATNSDPPSFRDNASAASISISTASQRAGHLVDIQSAQRAEALVEVTLAAISAQRQVLEEMKTLALTLADPGIQDTERIDYQARYTALSNRLDAIAEQASLDGRNLIAGDLPEEGGGDLVLADGTTVGAVDLRRAGTTVNVLDPPGGPFVRPAFAENIIAAIAFEEGAGGTAAPLDWTINSPSATLVNGAGWGSGRYGDGGVSLPGSLVGGTNSPHVAIRDLDFGNEVTFAFNIRVENLAEINDNGFMAFWETGSFANRVVIRTNRATNDSFLVANVKDNVWTGVTGGPGFPDDQWVHLAGTIAPDGTTALYFDGVKIVEGMTQPLADKPREEIRLGATMFNSQGSVRGEIGDVVIYNRAFDAGEVNLLYQAVQGGVERWAPTGSASNWSHAAAEASSALTKLQAVESTFASAARTIAARASLNRALVDTLDASLAKSVNFDAGSSAARLEAARVRQQLAVASLQSRAGVLSSSAGLFASALNTQAQRLNTWRLSG